MKISSVNSSVTNLPKINFKSSNRNVYDFNTGREYNTATCFFRNDVDWENLVNILEKNFKNTDKVNIIIHACSSGEEALSVAFMLDSVLGEKAKKYYPIIAKDYDTMNIKMAKNGIFNIRDDEIKMFDTFVKSNNDYKIVKNGIDKLLVTNPDGIIKNIEFSQADILKDINNIPKENTVLFCRNFWPYLKIGERNDMIKKLGQNLKQSSLVILGAFDTFYGIDKVFEEEGFKKKAKQFFIFEKMPNYQIALRKITKKMFFI